MERSTQQCPHALIGFFDKEKQHLSYQASFLSWFLLAAAEDNLNIAPFWRLVAEVIFGQTSLREQVATAKDYSLEEQRRLILEMIKANPSILAGKTGERFIQALKERILFEQELRDKKVIPNLQSPSYWEIFYKPMLLIY